MSKLRGDLLPIFGAKIQDKPTFNKVSKEFQTRRDGEKMMEGMYYGSQSCLFLFFTHVC